nr:hypothetical protein [Tanacetum cinerariifolium]
PPAGLAAAADELSPTSYPGPKAKPSFFRGGGGEDQGDNGDAGGEDIASSLITFESDQAGI